MPYSDLVNANAGYAGGLWYADWVFQNLSNTEGSFHNAPYHLISVEIDKAHLWQHSWLAKTSSPFARQSQTSLAWQGRMYGVGGYIAGTVAQSSNAWYSDTNNAWTTAASVGAASYQNAGFASQLYGYVVGGSTGVAISSNSQYNFIGNAWVAKTVYPVAASASAGAFLMGYGWVVGGTALSSVYRYTEVPGTWTAKTVAPFAIGYGQSKFLIDEEILYATTNWINSGTSSAFRYTPAIDAWLTMNPFNGGIIASNGFSANSNVLGFSGNIQCALFGTVVDAWRIGLLAHSATSANSGTESANGSSYLWEGGAVTPTFLSSHFQYGNAFWVTLPTLHVSSKTPTRLLLGGSVAGDINGGYQFGSATRFPVQLNTDGTNWKYLHQNSDSATRFGETLVTKFAANADGNRIYQAKIGIQFSPLTSNRGFFAQRPLSPVGMLYSHLVWIGYQQILSCGSVAISSTYSYTEYNRSWVSKAGKSVVSTGSQTPQPLRGKMFTVAGNGAAGAAISTTQMYDEVSNAWTSMADLVYGAVSGNTTWTSFGDLTYSLGGFTGAVNVSSLYWYMWTTNVWTTAGVPFGTNRFSYGQYHRESDQAVILPGVVAGGWSTQIQLYNQWNGVGYNGWQTNSADSNMGSAFSQFQNDVQKIVYLHTGGKYGRQDDPVLRGSLVTSDWTSYSTGGATGNASEGSSNTGAYHFRHFWNSIPTTVNLGMYLEEA